MSAGQYLTEANFPKLSDLPQLSLSIKYDNDPVSDVQYNQIIYANKPDTYPGKTAFQQEFFAMKARHLIYWKNTNPPQFQNGIQLSLGSCGSAGGGAKPGEPLKILDDVAKGLKIGGAVLTTTISLAAAVEGTSTGALVASCAAIGTLTGIFSIATFGIGLILAPLAFLFAKHAKAVALEQGTLCEMFQQINPLIDDIDQNFYSSQITMAQAETAWQNLLSAYIYQASKVIKGENEGEIIEQEIQDNWRLRKEILYKNMIPTTPNIFVGTITTETTTNAQGQQITTTVKTPAGTLPSSGANAPAAVQMNLLNTSTSNNNVVMFVVLIVIAIGAFLLIHGK
jgi:hypothetical protein